MQLPTVVHRACSMGAIKAFVSNSVRSRFVRNVAIVASGAACAQAITIAFSPVITRLYGPEAFGLLGMFTAIASVIGPIAALTYPIAIVLPKEDQEAKGIARLCVWVSLGIATLLFLLLLSAGDRIISLLRLQNIGPFVFLIPISVFFAASLQVAEQWLIRKEKFSVIARATMIQVVVVNTLKVAVGLFKPVAAALIVITVAGTFFNAGMLAFGARVVRSKKKEQQAQGPVPLWNLAKKHYDFPLYRAPQDFINAISQSLPILMLASFFGPASAGFYTLCIKMLAFPSQLIGKSIGDVFYPRITVAAHNRENLTRLILKATFALAAVGFVPFGTVVVSGPWLFGLVFGNQWILAGEYARWLALWMYFMFLNNPSVRVLPIISAQGFNLVFTILTIGVRLAVLLVGFYGFSSDRIAIALFGISGALINIVWIGIVVSMTAKLDHYHAALSVG